VRYRPAPFCQHCGAKYHPGTCFPRCPRCDRKHPGTSTGAGSTTGTVMLTFSMIVCTPRRCFRQMCSGTGPAPFCQHCGAKYHPGTCFPRCPRCDRKHPGTCTASATLFTSTRHSLISRWPCLDVLHSHGVHCDCTGVLPALWSKVSPRNMLPPLPPLRQEASWNVYGVL
jgi:hypothetical protein